MENNEKLTSAPENGDEQVRKLSSSATIGGTSERNLHIDGKVEQKLLLKLDLYIAPVVMLLYLIAFLDRYSHSPQFPNALDRILDMPMFRA
jgi:hypothetical protein